MLIYIYIYISVYIIYQHLNCNVFDGIELRVFRQRRLRSSRLCSYIVACLSASNYHLIIPQ